MKRSIDPETGTCMHTFYRDEGKYRTCLDCGESECRCCGEKVCELEEDDSSPLDEPWDIDPELMDFWRSRSEFAIPDCFEIGHVVEGGCE